MTLISASSASPSVISGTDREVQKRAKCQEQNTGFISKTGKNCNCSQLGKEHRLQNLSEHKNMSEANLEWKRATVDLYPTPTVLLLTD